MLVRTKFRTSNLGLSHKNAKHLRVIGNIKKQRFFSVRQRMPSLYLWPQQELPAATLLMNHELF